ncbi:lipopolysaccharide transport periplasmic protein LptA [Marinobacterium jannaschii]|uniref:lipopolysaccharide transport periplasmic protein LptA n=1 Tax=Marinobacterium jannaschii TaxID=64970 RepID=UPI000688C071|nr:lipopolysaccharide transport periplasmic protein LptA [Marinobacterium jannaschii]
MINRSIKGLAFILLCSLSLGASALPDDRNQPIHISANSAMIDEASGHTIYRGNVIIKQGSILIEGETLELQRGNDGVESIKAKGEPAHFRQQTSKGGPYSDAYGSTILYMVEKDLLTVTEKAKVINDKDTFSGEKIVYDLKRSIVDAFGDKDETASGGRIQMVIQPKKKETE